MAKARTIDLLERVMADGSLAPADLDALLVAQTAEDLHLDYKDGALLAEKTAGTVVREYVSAFANSDGGILIIGIDDKALAVTGCKAHGGGTLHDWAATCLTDLAAQLSPPPRIFTIPHAQGEVLVVATARAPRLVPVVVSGRPTYYFRLGHQTLPADPYLIADLMVGRRQRPNLTVISASADAGRDVSQPGVVGSELKLTLVLRNDGIVWADGLVGGGVFLSCRQQSTGMPRLLPQDVPDAILQHIEVKPTTFWPGLQLHLTHLFARGTGEVGGLAPLNAEDIWFPDFVIPHRDGQYHIEGAVYFLPRGSPPQWFQVRMTFRYGDRRISNLKVLPVLDGDRAVVSYVRAK